MRFHSDFWAVAGTAAPVIALSCIVLIADTLNHVYEWGHEISPKPGRRSLKAQIMVFVFLNYLINGLNITLQANALFQSLTSLLDEKNSANTGFITQIEALGIAGLVISTLLTVIVRILISQFDEESAPVKQTAWRYRVNGANGSILRYRKHSRVVRRSLKSSQRQRTLKSIKRPPRRL